MKPYPSVEIKTAYSQGSAAQRKLMNTLREMALDTAANLEGAGEIEETLKWGQPTISTVRPKTGSPFRISFVKHTDDKVALYFICTTTLIQEFRERYGDELTFEDNRAVILDCSAPLSVDALKHCMAMAMMYNRR